jgi:hypothetical protein
MRVHLLTISTILNLSTQCCSLFLQGVDTDDKEVARVREALQKGDATYTGTFLNYKKNGAPFWNQLTLSPISNDKGVVIKYMG